MVMLILAIIAFLLIFKLFKEFGKTKNEPVVTIDDIENSKMTRAAIEDLLSSINKSGKTVQRIPLENENLDSEIIALQERLPGFSPTSFLTKAEEMFDSVFNAFANSHHHTLKENLTEDLYENFASQIQKREENSLRQEILIRHKRTTLEKIQSLASKVRLFVSFDVSQMSAIINADGVSFDNPKRLYRDVIHKWVFEKQRNEDPWILSKTSSEEKSINRE